jgi:hypothetical protein
MQFILASPLLAVLIISCGSTPSTPKDPQSFILKGKIQNWNQGISEVRMLIPIDSTHNKEWGSSIVSENGQFSITPPPLDQLVFFSTGKDFTNSLVCIKANSIITNNPNAKLYPLSSQKVIYKDGKILEISSAPPRSGDAMFIIYASAKINISGECDYISSALRPPDLAKFNLDLQEGYNVIKSTYQPTNRDIYAYTNVDNQEISFYIIK